MSASGRARKSTVREIGALVAVVVLTLGVSSVLVQQLSLRLHSASRTAAVVQPTRAAVAAVSTITPLLPTSTVPPARPAQSHSGLGVSRAALQSAYMEAGFVFDAPGRLATGEPRVIGQMPDGASVELIGSPDDLRKVTLLVGIPDFGDRERTVAALHIVMLANMVASSHSQAITDWIGEQIVAETDGRLRTGRYQSQVTILRASDGLVVSFSISRA